MGFRSRVYYTAKLGKNKKIVSSISTSNYCLWVVIKYFCIGIFYLMFFWIIIPIKLIRKRKQ